ncbi:MAG: TatD family hydrolase [Burkholderiales bacterium]|jgi:TatD DNase family protein
MEIIDSHCHINFPQLGDDLEGVLSRMHDAGVSTALCVSVNLESFPQVLKIAEQHDNVYASVGVHPDEAEGENPQTEQLVALSQHPKIVGIGETGLDYYRLEGDLTWQRERFRNHVRAARETGKPLIIHTRSAGTDTIDIMRTEHAEAASGVMHCFTETWEVAKAALDLGFMISFSGILTFKSAGDLREVARKVPLDSILVETDSPYLAPVPHRGKTNEPAYVTLVAEQLAEVKQLPLETIAEATSANFRRLFRINQV